MKKLILAVFLFVLSSFTAFAGSFPDVKSDNENYEAIEYLKSKNIIQGYPNGNFGPDDMVDRAAAVKMIMEAFGLSKNNNYEAVFTDVKKTAWYAPYILGAKDIGFISGYEDKTFKPEKYVTLVEALKIILAAKNVEIPSKVSSAVAIDISADEWFSTYALYARDNNVVLPDIEGKMFPNKTLTRAAFAEVLYRIVKVLESGKPFDISSQWLTYDNSSLPFKIKYNDKTWQIITHKNEVTFFYPDKGLNQFSPIRIYPNSAKLIFTVDPNEGKLNKDAYFSDIKKAFPDGTPTEFNVGDLNSLEILHPKQRYVDWYIFLPNNYVLIIYTDYGNGPVSFRIPQIIKGMLSTLQYRDTDLSSLEQSKTQLLNKIFSNILVAKKGMEMLNLIPDKTIIETDAIGVGTGPVDYYFSQDLNYTFKYERSSDTILNKKEGNTSKF